MIANTDEFKVELELLKTATTQFCKAFDKFNYIELCNTPKGQEKSVLRDVLTAYEYDDDQESNTVKPCVGYIVAPSADDFLQFNQSREQWRTYLKVKGRQKMKVHQGSDFEYVNMVKYMMSATGNSRLHRKQIRREFVIIEGKPLTVSFAQWQNTKQTTISREYGDELFKTITSNPEQQEAYTGSKANELYMVSHPYESYKANVSFIPPYSDEVIRKTVATTLPVVFITGKQTDCSLNFNVAPEKRVRNSETRGKHLFTLESYKVYEKLPTSNAANKKVKSK